MVTIAYSTPSIKAAKKLTPISVNSSNAYKNGGKNHWKNN